MNDVTIPPVLGPGPDPDVGLIPKPTRSPGSTAYEQITAAGTGVQPSADDLWPVLHMAQCDRTVARGWGDLTGLLSRLNNHAERVVAAARVRGLVDAHRRGLVPETPEWAGTDLQIGFIQSRLYNAWAEEVWAYAHLAGLALQALAEGIEPAPHGHLPGESTHDDSQAPAHDPVIPAAFAAVPVLRMAAAAFDAYEMADAEYEEAFGCDDDHDDETSCGGVHIADHQIDDAAAMEAAIPDWNELLADYATAAVYALCTDLRPRLTTPKPRPITIKLTPEALAELSEGAERVRQMMANDDDAGAT